MKARIAGIFDFLEGVMSAFGENAVPGSLVVVSDAAATANNILTQEPLFRLALLAGLIAVACHIVWTFLFYELFTPVNRSVALLAAFVSLIGIALQAVSNLFQLAPLVLLQDTGAFGSFTVPQLQELALLLLQLRVQLFNTYIAFFGLWCVLTGYLIFRSTFMPRVIGLLEAFSGLCWLTFAWPPLASALFPLPLGALAAPGEFSLQVWLIIFGVNSMRWRERARVASSE